MRFGATRRQFRGCPRNCRRIVSTEKPLETGPAGASGRRHETTTREPGDLPSTNRAPGGVPWQGGFASDRRVFRTRRTIALERPTPTDRHEQEPDDHGPVALDSQAAPAVTLFVCTTCRVPGTPAEEPPQGGHLAEAVAAAAADPGVVVRPVRCLSNCKRGLSAAMVRAGGWSYVFGDLTPQSAPDLLAGASLFAGATEGIMPWRGRPDCLKRGMIARVPPLSFIEEPR